MLGNKYSVFYSDFWKFRISSGEEFLLKNSKEINRSLQFLVWCNRSVLKQKGKFDYGQILPYFELLYCKIAFNYQNIRSGNSRIRENIIYGSMMDNGQIFSDKINDKWNVGIVYLIRKSQSLQKSVSKEIL